jgi:hypothetical protein
MICEIVLFLKNKLCNFSPIRDEEDMVKLVTYFADLI